MTSEHRAQSSRCRLATAWVLVLFYLVGCSGKHRDLLPLAASFTTPVAGGDGGPWWGVELRRGETLHLDVEQLGVDVAVSVFDPNGEVALEIDSQNVAWGPEVLWWTAPHDGLHRVALRRLKVSDRGLVRMFAEVLTQGDATVGARVRACADLDEARRAEQHGARAAALHRAIAAWGRAGEGEQVALAWLALAESFERQGKGEDEVASCTEALREVRAGSLPDLEILVLQRLGRAWRRVGDRAMARRFQEESLALAQSQGNPRRAGLALRHLARLAQDDGDFLAAAHDGRDAVSALRRAGDLAEVAGAVHDLSFVYTVLGRRAEAREGYLEALAIRRQLGDARGVAVTLTEIGWLDMEEGASAKAIASYEEALELHRQSGDLRNQAGVLDRLGSALMAEGQWAAARTAYEDSLALSRGLGSSSNQANTLCNLAELEAAAGRPQEALRRVDQALELYDTLSPRELVGEVHVRHVRSLAELALGHLEKAEVWSAAALERVEEMQRNLASQALSLPFFAVRREYLDQYVSVLMARHRESPTAGWRDRALAAVERGRARGLLENLLARMATKDGAQARHRSAMQGRINAAHRQRIAVADPQSPRAAELDRELRSLTHQLAELTGQVDADAVASRFLGGREIQGLLEEETSLLTFHLGAQEGFLWVTDRHGTTVHDLPPAADIETLARGFSAGVRQPHAIEAGDQGQLFARALGQMLLGDIVDLADRHRLVVVADGILHYVPFAALEEPGAGTPLAARHEVVRIPSASVLAVLRSRAAARPAAPRAMAILADPVFDPWDLRVVGAGAVPPGLAKGPSGEAVLRSALDLGLGTLSRLQGSRREAEAIASFLPASEVLVALDFTASRAIATTALSGQFRILHFATHGLLHPRHDELSGLVLSLVDEAGHAQDGFLRVHELAALDLGADLAVLSACHTALGSAMRGEGLLGLPRSLMEAGASTVLVSLWMIDDEAAAEFMTHFYRGLLVEGLPPAGALVRAQRSMWSDASWRDPFYWAGFELQGDWRGKFLATP